MFGGFPFGGPYFGQAVAITRLMAIRTRVRHLKMSASEAVKLLLGPIIRRP